MSEILKIKMPRALLEASAAAVIQSASECGQKIGVACSGGADSVCALLWVAEVFAKNRANVFVLHFNHRERLAAKDDCEFVENLANRLGVNFVTAAPDKVPEKITENALRKMRIGFLLENSARLGLAAIVQGHNSGDVAETLIMRLMRGAGTAGMSAPRPLSHFKGALFARPLLNLAKADIKKILSEAKIVWREDETNSSADFLRNRIRAEVVPQLDKLCAGSFANGALRSRSLFAEDCDFIDKIFAREIITANPSLDLSNVENPPRLLLLPEAYRADAAFVRRSVEKLLSINSVLTGVRSGCIDSFVNDAIAKGAARAHIGENSEIFFDGKSVRIEKSPEKFAGKFILKLGKNLFPDGRAINVKKVSLTQARFESIKKGDNDDSVRAYIDLLATGGTVDKTLIARGKLDGDRYPPLGSRSPKKLKEIFNAKKIPLWKRKSAIIVCNSKGDILWSPGLPPSNFYKVANSHSVIELTFEDF